MDVEVSKVNLPPRVGIQSLVGIPNRKFPLRLGNYCTIRGGPYLCNCWAENLTEWASRNPDVEEIEVTVIRHADRSIGLVTDQRLVGWLNARTCVTGNGWPSVAAMRLVCDLLGIEPDTLCGCEKDEESPVISQTYQHNIVKFRCGRCGRSWS